MGGVWSPVYVDALILRDRDTDGDGTLDERLWVVQDANYNVTAFFDNAGNVVERYVYDPFGQATVLDANWNVLAASAFAWVYLHQGGRYDVTSGLYHFRNRDYSLTLGRWTSLDPLSYAAGDVNLYRYVSGRVTTVTDPYGLADKEFIGKHDLELVKIVAEAEEQIKSDIMANKWRPDPKDPGSYGKELECRVYERLKNETVRSGILRRKYRSWYTNITVEINTLKIIELDGIGGVRNTKNHVQIDIVRMKPGYELKIGQTLNHDHLEDIYDIKANRDGNLSRRQRDALKKLINNGDVNGNRRIKVIHAKHRQQNGIIVENPYLTRAVKFFSAIGALIALNSTAFAMIRSEESEPFLDKAIEKYKFAVNQKMLIRQIVSWPCKMR